MKNQKKNQKSKDSLDKYFRSSRQLLKTQTVKQAQYLTWILEQN